ncbi:MAG: hypothetical protein AAGI52_06540 [Bacteroidota bacterium]
MPDFRLLSVFAAVLLASLLYASCESHRADRAEDRVEQLSADIDERTLERDRAVSERDGLRLALAEQMAAVDSVRQFAADQAERVTEAGDVAREIERDTRAEVEAILVQPPPPDDSVGSFLLEQAERLGEQW